MDVETHFRRTRNKTLNWDGVTQRVDHILWVAFVIFVLSAIGQGIPQDQGLSDHREGDSQAASGTPAQLPAASQAELKAEEKPSGNATSLIIAPMPISSPALGTGVVPVLGYIFPLQKNDKVSPPSVIGAAGLVTNNGSRGFGAYADLFLKEDTYRITSVYIYGNLNYDLYGIGIGAGREGQKFPLEQSGQVFRGEVLRRVGWDFFVGLRFWSGGSVVTARASRGGPAAARRAISACIRL
jgi:hypothetical protein